MGAARTAEKRGISTAAKRAGRKAEPYNAGEARLAKMLTRCIDARRTGKDIEQVLSRYPEEAMEVRPLLEIAEILHARSRAAHSGPRPRRLRAEREPTSQIMGDASGEATPEASLPFPYRRLYPSLFAFVLAATESERAAELPLHPHSEYRPGWRTAGRWRKRTGGYSCSGLHDGRCAQRHGVRRKRRAEPRPRRRLLTRKKPCVRCPRSSEMLFR
jgi:hypothetical protein